MAKTLEQFEKNVSASFGYVKKDLLMLNDSVSDIHNKIQHLSLNHASLLQEIEKLKRAVFGSESSRGLKISNKKPKKSSKKRQS